jgi:hypothetical protein
MGFKKSYGNVFGTSLQKKKRENLYISLPSLLLAH